MKRTMPKLLAVALVFAMALSFLPGGMQTAQAVSDTIVISQVYGGGGNSGATYANDFVELFNRGTTTVSLAGWSLQYASAAGTGLFGSNTGQITPLSGSIAPGQYFLVQEASNAAVGLPLPTPNITDTTPINMSGTAGKVALTNTTTPMGCNGGSTPCTPTQLSQVVDLVGYGTGTSGANFYEGTGPAPTISPILADLRKSAGTQDTDDNAADFAAGAPNPRNSSYPFVASGMANPIAVTAGLQSLLTVTVTPVLTDPASTGITVSCDLTPIGGLKPQSFYDDGTNGDLVAGDNTFSFVTIDTVSDTKTVTCDVNDAQGRKTTAAISITLLTVAPIGKINGTVLDTEDGTKHASTYVNKIVAIQGVIYETTLQAIKGTTDTYKGFFIQNTAATADTDPNSSDGLFVFMNTASTMSGPNGPYTPTVGDEVVLSGSITEYFNMTELQNPALALQEQVRSGVDINAEVAPVTSSPPANLADANRYWERLQGMRVQVPQGSITLSGRNVFSPADAEIWVASPTSTIGERLDPYTNRAFRDAHPLDDNYDPTNWDGNGYRILMGSLGIKALEGDGQALIDPARTFETVTNAPAGGINYTFSKYRIEISEHPQLSEGPDPAANNPPQAVDRAIGYSIVDYNLENLYDARDNPFSGCDFTGDSGCPKMAPFLSAVNPPYDYVPANEAAYQARLNDIALEIINDLHSPDILMVQEVENQDICSVTGGALTCGAIDNADGKPDVLQELALQIAVNGGPAFDAAFDRNSSDLRGIAPAFLYRTDRVKLLPAAGDPILGTNPAIVYAGSGVAANADVSNPKTFNAILPAGVPGGACETSWVFPRAPDVGLFRIFLNKVDSGSYRDVYLINNHFKSGPDSCVGHRTEQAKYNAALVAFLEAANPEARIIIGGDLNVYPRPDDPFAPIGQPTSSDQLGSLYAAGLTNLWDVLLGQAPEAAYSYVYLGQAQTLDQMFVNQNLLADLQQYRIAHINSDFAADYAGDVARSTSDHDPNVANFEFKTFNWSGFFQPVDNLPELNVSKAGTGIPVKFNLGGDEGLNIFASGYPLSTKIACDTSEPQDNIETTVTTGTSSLQYDPLTGQYTYVWKTEKAWANTCRQLIVKLVDGDSFMANFKFTK